ncbi:MAG: tyrosine-type recombinase/integrase [Sulfuricurvum sp.]|nr:tyrosine-type recombinase/integrase [Sulfuricurvum sp.]
MAFRSIKAKKYSGISEYYNPNDHDKATKAFYITVRDIENKPKKIKTDAKNKDEALEELNKYKAETIKTKKIITRESSNLQDRVRNELLTIDDMAALYYPTRTAKNNIKDHAAYKNHISPLVGKRKAATFTTKDVLELQSNLLKKKVGIGSEEKRPIATKTVDDLINQLKAIFYEGMRDSNRWVIRNPVADKDVKKLTDSRDATRLRVLTDEELQTLFNLASTKPRLYLLLKLLYHTAARPAAIIELQVKDIDFTHGKIYLKAMKKAKAYNVPMVDSLKELVKQWIDEHDLKPSHYVFYPIQTGDKNKPAIYENFKRAAKKIMDEEFNEYVPTADKRNRVTMYTLRHTAATVLVKKFGIKIAKDYLNHSDLKVTEIYAKIADEDMKGAANGL